MIVANQVIFCVTVLFYLTLLNREGFLVESTSSSFALQAFDEINSEAHLEGLVPRRERAVVAPFL